MNSETDRAEPAITIRYLGPQDIDTVLAMERLVFPDPWPREAFEEQLESPDWGGLVAECRGEIIGYACYLIVAQEAHLANIAVAPAWRRKSVANRLMQRILDIVNEHRCEMLLLEVRISNAAAIAFYTKFGFEQLYRRRNYYRRPIEDAQVMVRYLTRP
ncbi:MAG: ribosomal protein S18-alanine N-acetyltransferase [Candidatus Zixiibacteriota bacterium]